MSVFLRALAMALAVIGLAPSLVLLVVCRTAPGAVFAVGAILLCAALALSCVAWEKGSRRLWMAACGSFCGWLGATVWLLAHAPDGRTTEAAPVQHRYVGDQWAFQRYALGNLLPEVDQLGLGFRVMPVVDQLFTMKQAGAVSDLTAAIYGELEADAHFHALGSVMPGAYDELWGLPFDHGHYILYVPPGLDRQKPHPALVFLHGSGGNFKAYTWLLSKVADKRGMILIVPSFGMGNWSEPATSALITSVLDDASRVVSIDPAKLHLMGISNGGLGVSQAAREMGDRFHSLTFLSPVFDRQCLSSQQFAAHWHGRPVLVITGRQDDRVPFDYVSEAVDSMKSAGAKVTLKAVDQADHFMLFSHRDVVIGTVVEWLGEGG